MNSISLPFGTKVIDRSKHPSVMKRALLIECDSYRLAHSEKERHLAARRCLSL